MSFNHCSSTFELFIFATNITAGAVLMLTCNHQQVENLLDWPLGPSDAKLGTTVFFSSIWQLGTILEFNCALAFLGLRTERSTRRACCSAKVAYQGLAPASLAVCARNILLLSVCFPHGAMWLLPLPVGSQSSVHLFRLCCLQRLLLAFAKLRMTG